jgi:hypothetical protein
MRRPQRPSTTAGTHRFVWDLHYPPPKSLSPDYPISAIYMDTPRYPIGPAVLPGQYTVRLTASGRSQSQSFTVKMDPRVRITEAGLKLQHDLGVRLANAMSRDFAALQQVRAARSKIKTQSQGAKRGELADSLVALDSALVSIESGVRGGPAQNLVKLNADLATLLDIVEGADAEPTTQTVAATAALEQSLAGVLSQWAEVQRTRLTKSK